MTDDEVVDRIVLRPDPGLVRSLGAHHSLESGLADLIDNSIDAGATQVRIRFSADRGRLRSIVVLDDGRGMDDEAVNNAMTLGRRREYGEGSLGSFGLGLKAAGLGNAEVLTVWSQRYGASPVGRRLRKADMIQDFGCEVLTVVAAAGQEALRSRLIGGKSGTTVVLDHVHAYHGESDVEAQVWMTHTLASITTHLGVVFHRLLDKKRIRIDIEQTDAATGRAGIPTPVRSIDPFGYSASGRPGYPRMLTADVDGTEVALECHIWPAKADVTSFRMGRKSGEEFQGFYVYRSDRLLQVGGWGDVVPSAVERQLARVVMEGDELVNSLVTMTPEKQGIRFKPALRKAIGRATSANAGSTFDSYLADSEEAYKAARRRNANRKPAIRPDKGFSPAVRKVIGSELDFKPNEDPIDIRWTRMPLGEFLDVDFKQRIVWLNNLYRDILVPVRGGLNDAPLIKSLVYLLTRDVFEGDYLGSRDRDNIALWQAVLGAAADEEVATFQRRQR